MAGAALDVTDPEPLPQDHPLWSAPNAIVTPHITGGSFGHLAETTEQILQLCRENLCRYRQGRELQNRVNFETGYTVTRG
jgi:phosphoglycerate dehydrogenase-like enzyme